MNNPMFIFPEELKAGMLVNLGIGMKEGLNDAADDRSVRMGVKLRF